MTRLLTLFFLYLIANGAEATEIEGSIKKASGAGAGGALVTVACGKYMQSTTAGNDGRYRINNVPDGEACTLLITFSGAKTNPYPFRSNSGKLTFNQKIKQYGSRLVVF